MAKVKVLQRRVVAHKWREPGEVVEVGDWVARQLAEADPESLVWLDRPVQAFVDVVPAAPVVAPAAEAEPAPASDLVLRQPRRRGKKLEVGDADESAG